MPAVTAPLIGLTTYRQEAAWGVWHTRADLLPTEYAVAVEAAGGVTLLLPPVAAAVAFLASDDSSFITASEFLVDGGISGAYVTPV